MSHTDAPITEPRGDGELLAEFAASRVETAFAEVVRRHGGMVLSVCRSVLGSTTDAEDAAQAVFLTLAKKAHSSSVQARLVGWLHRVAWYVAARGAEARAIRRRHEQEAARMRQELQTSEPEPIQLDLLHAGLAQLSEKYRVPLILHHMEGRSHAETAALSGCSVDAVRHGVRSFGARALGGCGAWAFLPGLVHPVSPQASHTRHLLRLASCAGFTINLRHERANGSRSDFVGRVYARAADD